MRDLLDNLDKITEAPKPVAKISAGTFLGFMYQDNDDISELGERMLKQLIPNKVIKPELISIDGNLV